MSEQELETIRAERYWHKQAARELQEIAAYQQRTCGKQESALAELLNRRSKEEGETQAREKWGIH